MEANEYSRVAVVCYSGIPNNTVDASKVLFPLKHYSAEDTYFTVDRSVGSPKIVSWDIDGENGTHEVTQPHATNTQMGLYTGMDL